MLPVWTVILVAVISSVGTAVIQWWRERDREPALVARLTEEANKQIYASYSELIGALRQDAKLAREEARSAKDDAQQARISANAAEARAAGAEQRAAASEAAMVEMRSLVRQHVPDAGELLSHVEQLLNRLPVSQGKEPVR